MFSHDFVPELKLVNSGDERGAVALYRQTNLVFCRSEAVHATESKFCYVFQMDRIVFDSWLQRGNIVFSRQHLGIMYTNIGNKWKFRQESKVT